MGRWLEVTEGGTDRPRPVLSEVDDGLVLARAYEIVAHGIVNGPG